MSVCDWLRFYTKVCALRPFQTSSDLFISFVKNFGIFPFALLAAYAYTQLMLT